MGIDTNDGGVFMRRKGRVIRHLEKHQGIAMEFWYTDTETGREFDVRDFTDDMLGPVTRDEIFSGDRDAHKKAIRHVLDAGLPLKVRQLA